MSTYIINNSVYSGQVIMNIGDVELSNDPVISFSDPVSIEPPGPIGPSISFCFPYMAVGDVDNQKVYVYETDGSSWSLLSTIIAPDGSSAFASSVSMKDSVISVSDPSYGSNSGRVYVYFFLHGSWSLTPNHIIESPDAESELLFGSNLVASEHYLAILAPNYKNADLNAGAIYLYYYNNVQDFYVLESTILSDSPSAQGNFGKSIGIIGDDTMVVSSPYANITSGTTLSNAGMVEIFKKSNNAWSYYSTLTSSSPIENGNFGYSLSAQIERIVVGEPGSNTIHIFDYHSPNWNIIGSISYGTTSGLNDTTVSSTDLQGYSVSQESSERSFIWSAPKNSSNGCVYVAETTPAGNIVPSITSKLLPTDPSDNEMFGASIYYDGTYLISVSTGGNSGSGEIFVFKRN